MIDKKFSSKLLLLKNKNSLLKKTMTINSGHTKPPIKPEIVFLGLIFVNVGPFKILPKK